MKDALVISESGSNEGPRFGGGLRLSGGRSGLSFASADPDRAPVAQWIERRPPEPKVAGSNPVGRAIPTPLAFADASEHTEPYGSVSEWPAGCLLRRAL